MAALSSDSEVNQPHALSFLYTKDGSRSDFLVFVIIAGYSTTQI